MKKQFEDQRSQNELLVKRYMRARDVYVHADVHGAATVLVRNDAGGVVPMRTVQEAATFAVCRSKAWTAKLAGGTAAWSSSPRRGRPRAHGCGARARGADAAAGGSCLSS